MYQKNNLLYHGNVSPQIPAYQQSGQEMPSSGQQMPSSGQQMTSSGQQMTSSGQQMPSSGQQMPSSGQAAFTSNYPPNYPSYMSPSQTHTSSQSFINLPTNQTVYHHGQPSTQSYHPVSNNTNVINSKHGSTNYLTCNSGAYPQNQQDHHVDNSSVTNSRVRMKSDNNQTYFRYQKSTAVPTTAPTAPPSSQCLFPLMAPQYRGLSDPPTQQSVSMGTSQPSQDNYYSTLRDGMGNIQTRSTIPNRQQQQQQRSGIAHMQQQQQRASWYRSPVVATEIQPQPTTNTACQQEKTKSQVSSSHSPSSSYQYLPKQYLPPSQPITSQNVSAKQNVSSVFVTCDKQSSGVSEKRVSRSSALLNLLQDTNTNIQHNSSSISHNFQNSARQQVRPCDVSANQLSSCDVSLKRLAELTSCDVSQKRLPELRTRDVSTKQFPELDEKHKEASLRELQRMYKNDIDKFRKPKEKHRSRSGDSHKSLSPNGQSRVCLSPDSTFLPDMHQRYLSKQHRLPIPSRTPTDEFLISPLSELAIAYGLEQKLRDEHLSSPLSDVTIAYGLEQELEDDLIAKPRNTCDLNRQIPSLKRKLTESDDETFNKRIRMLGPGPECDSTIELLDEALINNSQDRLTPFTQHAVVGCIKLNDCLVRYCVRENKKYYVRRDVLWFQKSNADALVGTEVIDNQDCSDAEAKMMNEKLTAYKFPFQVTSSDMLILFKCELELFSENVVSSELENIGNLSHYSTNVQNDFIADDNTGDVLDTQLQGTDKSVTVTHISGANMSCEELKGQLDKLSLMSQEVIRSGFSALLEECSKLRQENKHLKNELNNENTKIKSLEDMLQKVSSLL